MHISIAQMELAYELLRSSPPFSDWHLPSADDVEFHAVPLPRDRVADCQNLGGAYRIRVCVFSHATLDNLLVTMAHEMCHMRADKIAPREKDPHGPKWQQCAKQVCKKHGWSRWAF